MSILEGWYNGRRVFADEGEELRRKDVLCIHCGAKMHLKLFPNETDRYHFVLQNGEVHLSVCKAYEGKKTAPAFTDISPEVLIAMISKKTEKRPGGGSGGVNITPPNDGEEDEPEDAPLKPKRITQLMQLVKAGIYDENPFDITYMGSSYRFLDFVIFDKWAKHVWGNNSLVKIGARIIDARWIGSLKYDADTLERIIIMMKEHKEIWLTMFWYDIETKETVFVRFCLDVSDCYGEVIKKLFRGGARSNGTYDEYIPKCEPLDVLVAAVFAMMRKDQCAEKCPLYPRKCKGCRGGYWCKINTVKQLLLFATNELTKNKNKKIYEKYEVGISNPKN